MRIWHENYTLEHVITLRDNNINKHLGIKFTDITDNSISATMPVEDITRQSRGVLHGGASCVLAESLGSIASNLCLDMRKQKAVSRLTTAVVDLKDEEKKVNTKLVNSLLSS